MQYKLLKALTELNWKDVATRSLWTFLQTFLATFLLSGESIIDLLFKGDWDALVTLLLATALAALAAGLSAVKTILVEVVQNLRAQNGTSN